MRVLAIINPNARAVAALGRHAWRERVAAAFEAVGVDAHIVDISGIRCRDVPERARAARADAVVAGGGDGTVSAVAGALAGRRMPLGILPVGTLNHFAKDLGLPLGLEDAARTIATGRVREVDVGEVNGRIFVNNCSIGLYPRIVRGRDSLMERLGRGKWISAALAAASVLRRFPLLGIRLRVASAVVARTTPFLFVGNNRYELDLLKLGRRVCLDCGQLSVYLPISPTRLATFRLAARAMLGLLEQGRDFESLAAPKFAVETRRQRLQVAIDGEVCSMRPPLRYRARPLALRVLVPREEPPTTPE
jgi:diacylglycerol kinase family enzyme